MDKEIKNKILAGTRNTINLKGHYYQVEIIDDEVLLIPLEGSGMASSAIPYAEYAYREGDEIYRLAVDTAKEIRWARIVEEKAKMKVAK